MLAAGMASYRAQAQDVVKPAAGEALADSALPPAVTTTQSPKPTAAEGPDIFLLPDETGKLRRVLGYRYEDFFKAWQGDEGGDDAAQPPQYVISSLSLNASAGAVTAKTTVTVEIELQSEDWVRAPLEMGSLIVEGTSIKNGSDRDFLMFDAPRGGYAAWLKGKPGDRVTIRLEGQLAIERNGDGQRLDLKLPAAAESVVTLSTPGPIKVESPANAVVASEVASEGQTRSRIDGVKGHLAVSWGQAGSERRRSAALEAVVDTVINVEAGRLLYEGFITVRGVRTPVERVQIELPPGATASTPSAGDGYEIVPVATDGLTDSASVVEVRFQEPAADPPLIRLTAEQSTAAARGTVLRAGAFEVRGAFRQRGNVAVRVSDQLHAHFEHDGRVTQIEPATLPDALLAEPPLAAFETLGAAWAIEVHIQPRQRKLSVTSNYQLHLGSQGAALAVDLDYQISGGKLFDLRIDLRGWELTEQPVESGGAVDLGEQHVTSEQILILPIKTTDAQQVRLRFSLRREAGLGVHDLPLPEVQDAFAPPGELTVTCDPAWRATAQIENSVGVSLVDPTREDSPVDSGMNANNSQLEAAALRLQTFLPQARLAVDISERDRVINVDSTVETRVQGSSLSARQILNYEILHQPATELTVTVSADLLANEGLELLLDGKPLLSTAIDVEPLSSSAAGEETSSDLRLVVRLPQPLVGRARLEVRSQLTLDLSQRTGAAAIPIPLALPQFPTKTNATVVSSGDSRVAIANRGGASPWVTIPEAAAAEGMAAPSLRRLQAQAIQPVRELALRLEPSRSTASVETRVEAAWAQTWVAAGVRQDRLVYRFHTTGARIDLALPTGFDEVEVMLNGRMATVERTRPGLLSVEVPSGNGEHAHTLELRTHSPVRINSWGKQRAAFPRIEGAEAWSPFFWQLILPPDLIALDAPAGMGAEYQFGWQGLRWGREPTQSQRDLERWTGATSAPTPSPRMNQYLYSSFEPPSAVEVTAVRRIWIVVAGGLAALAVGLAWLYTRIARTAAFWLVMCIAAGGFLFTYPEAAVLMVQAICLGGAFTLVSTITQWLLASGRPGRMASTSTAASSVASLTATQPWLAETPGPTGSAISATSGPRYQGSGAS